MQVTFNSNVERELTGVIGRVTRRYGSQEYGLEYVIFPADGSVRCHGLKNGERLAHYMDWTNTHERLVKQSFPMFERFAQTLTV